MVSVTLYGGEAAASYREEVLRVWVEVFGPVDDAEKWRESVWNRHRRRRDFRLATAHLGERLVGFSWGYTGEIGQYWSDLVLDRLGPAAGDWVGGHFEFVELAVLPGVRGRGIGAQLHDALLVDLPHERALLGTKDDPADPAVRLYQSRGWRHLGKQSATDQVMGLLLPADPSA